MDKLELLQILKTKRLSGSWYTFLGVVEDKSIRIKGYKTWLQIYKVNSIDYSNCMDRKVTEFVCDVLEPFK